jgi:hypothetical protein
VRLHERFGVRKFIVHSQQRISAAEVRVGANVGISSRHSALMFLICLMVLVNSGLVCLCLYSSDYS